MDELQCDDFFVPTFLLKLPPKPDSNGRYEHEDDFQKNTEGWAENFLLEDCI